MRRPPAPAWAVPHWLGTTPGYQLACDACQAVHWQPWDGPVPVGGLPDEGYMAQACPGCQAAVVAEVAPDWGWHRFPYPAWLVQVLEGWGVEP